jgi:23S rRNA (uracil1939-C5)-methyltransferase
MEAGRFTIGQEIELDIEGYTSEGEGVGRLAGAVCFVTGALAGEKVRARVTAVARKFYRAGLAAVLENAPARRRPACPLFGECGGCRLQHIAYPEQLRLKENRVRDALERIGGMGGDIVRPVRGMDDPWRYRNKVTFTAGEDNGRPILGFLRDGSRRVVDVPDCLLADKAAAPLARAAFEFCRGAGDRGVGRVTVRKNFSAGSVLIVIETGAPLAHGRETAERLRAADGAVAGVVNAVRGGGNGRTRYVLLSGEDRITETLAGIDFSVSAGAFFQVNPRQAEALYARAAGLVPAGTGVRVLDAYCGAGGFALFLARRAGSVLGVESNAAAVRDAADNARRNRFSNVRFMVGDLEKSPPLAARELTDCTDLMVDPPRRGLSPRFMAECAKSSVRRIIYASCDPATLARDCRSLAEKGFLATEITPFDMFPQTAHVESLALLERRQPG